MNIINYNFGEKIAFTIVLSTLVMLIVNLNTNIKLADA